MCICIVTLLHTILHTISRFLLCLIRFETLINTGFSCVYLLIFFSVGEQEQVRLEVPDEQEALIEEAKKRISDFVATEYDSEGADFSDLSNIGIAYTTTEDGLHEIQATVDLENTSIIKRVDGGVISLSKYETLADLVDALNDLDFADLTYLTDEQLEQVSERGNSDDDLKIT